MSQKFLKVFKQVDIKDVEQHLLVYGDLSAMCAHCQKMDLTLGDKQCPECRTLFKYIAFRNIKDHIPKMYKICEECPEIMIVDYDDYKRNIGAAKAQDFFK